MALRGGRGSQQRSSAVYPQSSFLLDGGEVNRTLCGRGHVLGRRANEYKEGGGISRAVAGVKGREASRSYAGTRKCLYSDSLQPSLLPHIRKATPSQQLCTLFRHHYRPDNNSTYHMQRKRAGCGPTKSGCEVLWTYINAFLAFPSHATCTSGVASQKKGHDC
jgi:hypothetical protein